MSHLTLGEIWWNMVLLHMTYPTMTERVHATALDFEAVADRIKHIHEHIMIVERSSVPSLKDTTRCAAP